MSGPESEAGRRQRIYLILGAIAASLLALHLFLTRTVLGSTIIASGMLRKPANPANDPLAPIRRMSQAEKIAFFS